VPGRLGHGTFLAPTGHPAEHQLRVPGQADIGSQPEPFGHTGTEALHQSVSLFQQLQDQGHSLGMFEVYGH
jgi:hypothetical protein